LQTTFDASLSGSGSLVKAGTGTLTLAATNTHSGGTTVSGGRLIVDGVSTNSTFIATSGGALAGHGKVGSTSILEGGILSPGNSPGTLTIEGDLMWANGGRYDWEIFQLAENGGAAGTGWDLVDVTGSLDLSALDGTSPFVISIFSLSGTNTFGPLAGFDYTQDYTWKIAQAAQPIAFDPANFATYFTIQTQGFTAYQPSADGIFSLALGEDGSSLFLHYSGAGATPVPEPATWLAALMLSVAATWVGWTHKSRRSRTPGGAKQF
jgi:autotransporter-associated beta strand protein